MSIFKKFKKEKKTEISKPEEKVKKPQEAAKTKTAFRKKEGVAKDILVRPLVSEKASFVGQYGQYIFEVGRGANKIEIAKAIFNTYGVKPVKINIVHLRGKEVRYGRTQGKTKARKKAIIILKPGEKIEVYEGV